MSRGRARSRYEPHQIVYAQGEDANAVFCILSGQIKLVVTSRQGKEAVVALLGEQDFFGEGCLAGQPVRLATAISLTDAEIICFQKAEMVDALQSDPAFARLFMAHLLNRNSRVEADFVDLLFNSSEKRLARILLLLANFGKEGGPQPITAKISQEMLAEMVGTTRPRVSFFMNKFRRLGLIEYNGKLKVHSSLLSVILQD